MCVLTIINVHWLRGQSMTVPDAVWLGRKTLQPVGYNREDKPGGAHLLKQIPAPREQQATEAAEDAWDSLSDYRKAAGGNSGQCIPIAAGGTASGQGYLNAAGGNGGQSCTYAAGGTASGQGYLNAAGGNSGQGYPEVASDQHGRLTQAGWTGADMLDEMKSEFFNSTIRVGNSSLAT